MPSSTGWLSDIEVAAYLDRIGHPPVTGPTAATLASLQDAHVRSVPFENLDIHLDVPLSLHVPDLVDKVVQRRRGGFCFELNGLFQALLTTLGFEAWLVEARALEDDGRLGPRFDHARILVAVDGEVVLVDVGTGASPRAPIRLVDTPQQVGHVRYRIRRLDDDGAGTIRYVSEREGADGWEVGWTFDTTPWSLEDFAERCVYHQTSPESHFTQKPLCSLVTEDGQVTLSDLELIVTGDGVREEASVEDPLGLLQERFGVALPRWPGRPPPR